MTPAKPLQSTVLLVEDDPDDRLIAARTFERSAPQVTLRMTVDGDDTMSYLSGRGRYADRGAHPLPQLVLLDLKLPRKSGLEVLEWIRGQPRFDSIMIFVLSSSQERGDIDRAYALGATSYMVKQVELGALRDIVRGIGEYLTLIFPLSDSPQD